jgi:hypothetical protein
LTKARVSADVARNSRASVCDFLEPRTARYFVTQSMCDWHNSSFDILMAIDLLSAIFLKKKSNELLAVAS